MWLKLKCSFVYFHLSGRPGGACELGLKTCRDLDEVSISMCSSCGSCGVTALWMHLISVLSVNGQWGDRIYSCVRISETTRRISLEFVRRSSSFIHSSVALQPFVGPLPLLQFRNLFYTDGRAPWTSDQPVARPLPTRRNNTNRINAHTDIHALSGIRTHDPSARASEE
jgi:hypothetical protein